MKKAFTLSDESFKEEFLSIFAVGLLECLKKDLINIDRAEQWLFSPAVAYSMNEKDFSKQFIFAMQYASELDACKGSEYYQKSISASERFFCEVLKNDVKQSVSTDPLRMIIDNLI